MKADLTRIHVQYPRHGLHSITGALHPTHGEVDMECAYSTETLYKDRLCQLCRDGYSEVVFKLTPPYDPLRPFRKQTFGTFKISELVTL